MDLFDIENEQLLNEKRKRVKFLEEQILFHQNAYYGNEALISDAEFDALWDELKNIDPDNPILQKIGSDLVETSQGTFQKAKHRMPMGSQDKAANPEEFLVWANKMSFPEYLVELKLDGASLELQYEQGQFIKGVTRGDGIIGDDITKNVLKMQGLVRQLPQKFSGGVRCEVLMSHAVHQQYFSDKANCRNAANGLMKRKDGSGSEHLHLICYDAVIEDTGIPLPFTNEEEKLQWLNSCGFETVKTKKVFSPEEVIAYRSQIMEERKNLPYDIDGLVIKNNIIDTEDAKRNRPEKQIAFKFSLEEAVSVLKTVEWSESGATYTPIGTFDTVELAGTKVSRANLVNTNTIRELKIFIGSHIIVTKRGEIIPKIESVIPPHNEKEAQKLIPISIPSVCGTCGTALIDEGTRLFCPNELCKKKIHHQLEKWVQVLDIRDLGETLLKKLFEANKVSAIHQLYDLTEEDLIPFFLNEESRLKEKKSLGAEKVYKAIHSKKKLTLSQFIAGFDIEGIAETMIEKLIEAGFTQFNQFLNATAEDFASVYGFGEITAKTLVQGIQQNRKEMELLVNNYLELETIQTEGKLQGLSFCFTGELHTLKRSEAENFVKKQGGSTKSSVTKDLSYLVTNDTESGSSKNLKAQKLGIPIIDEKTFLNMLNS